MQKPHAEIFFEAGHTSADRRFSQSELRSGGGEAAPLDDLNEHGYEVEIHCCSACNLLSSEAPQARVQQQLSFLPTLREPHGAAATPRKTVLLGAVATARESKARSERPRLPIGAARIATS
jgi:hypothetical protein